MPFSFLPVDFGSTFVWVMGLFLRIGILFLQVKADAEKSIRMSILRSLVIQLPFILFGMLMISIE
jgi:hypothetical protein